MRSKATQPEVYRTQTREETPATIQFLVGVRFSGKAELIPGGVKGHGLLFMEEGQIVHAVEPHSEGVAAIARMMCWDQVEFRLFRRVVSPRHDLSDPSHYLIVQAGILADQNAALWDAMAEPRPKQVDGPERAAPMRAWPAYFGYARVLLVLGIAAVLGLGTFWLWRVWRQRGTPPDPAVVLADFPQGSVALPTSAQARRVPGLMLELVPVPPGRFRRVFEVSSGDGVACDVRIGRAFLMSRCEITQHDYETVVGTNPSAFRGEGLPVDSVSWHDAKAFCEALTAKEREAGRLPSAYEYRLPTELEWEYACRAGRGDDAVPDVAVHTWYRENSEKRTHQVGLKQPNPWGVQDLRGNVGEWCLDWLGGEPGATANGGGQGAEEIRAVRGGSWLQTADYCTWDKRTGLQWETQNNITGFRVVLARQGERPRIKWH